MVRTEKGRVVYRRKKHEFDIRDAVRIVAILAKEWNDLTPWEKIQGAFRKVWATRNWTVGEMLNYVEAMLADLEELIRMFDGLLTATLLLKTTSGTSYGPTQRGFHRAIAKMARDWADTIEGD